MNLLTEEYLEQLKAHILDVKQKHPQADFTTYMYDCIRLEIMESDQILDLINWAAAVQR